MKSPIAIFMVAALAGCAAAQATLPAMPTIADVSATQAQLAAVSDPPAFFRAGAAQIIAGCGGYFDQLVELAQRNAQTSGQVSTATQALSAILGLAQVAPGPISILGVVGPAVAGAIANAQAGAPGGDHPSEMGTLIATEMNAYLAAIGNPPTDAAAAWMALYGLFRTCSPAGIEAAKQQALADAPNHIVLAGTPAPLSPSASPPLVTSLFAARPEPTGRITIPQVIIRSAPHEPTRLAQSTPGPAHQQWQMIQKHGRNVVEGGPRSLPAAVPQQQPVPPVIPSEPILPAAAAPIPPPSAIAPSSEPVPAAPPRRKL